MPQPRRAAIPSRTFLQKAARERRAPEEIDELTRLPQHSEIAQAAQWARLMGFDPAHRIVFNRVMRAAFAAYTTNLHGVPGRAGFVEHERRRHEEQDAPNRARHASVVYYMKLGGLIKIGTSASLRERVTALNPETVLAVEHGDRKLEQQRHAEFARYREHGEWFRSDPTLLRHIAQIRSRFEHATGRTLAQWLDAVRVPLSKAPSPG